MATTGYQGLPGSGKSYQVVTHTIVGALREGRRVVTNIDGINYGVIQAYLFDSGVPPKKIGDLLYVDNEAIEKEEFWYDPEDAENSITKPGDVLVIDEAWEFFENGTAIPKRAMNFFRYHRHYTNPQTGVACDIVLISQDIMDIGPKIRRVIEQTVSIHKLKEIGADNSFRLDIYQKTKIRGKPIYSEIGSYNPKFFQFYKSYAGKGDKMVIGGIGKKERRVEKRGTVWQQPFFKYVLPILIIVVVPLWAWWAWSFFSNYEKWYKKPEEIEAEQLKAHMEKLKSGELPALREKPGREPPKVIPAQENQVEVRAEGEKAAEAVETTPATTKEKTESKNYRIAGYYADSDFYYVILETSDERRIVLKDPEAFELDMLRSKGLYKGEIVTPSTGNSVGMMDTAKNNIQPSPEP